MHEVKTLYEHSVCRRCYSSFANRRHFAFLIDFLAWLTLILIFADTSWFVLLFPLLSVAFLGKDRFIFGCSPGKAVMGIKVIDRDTGNPINFIASIKRNLPSSIPSVGIIQIIVAFQLRKGQRIGDEWANTKVIWKKYEEYPIFLPTSNSRFLWTEHLKKEVSERKYDMAVKAEVKLDFVKAIRLYNEVINKFPETPIAKDANISLDALKKKMNT